MVALTSGIAHIPDPDGKPLEFDAGESGDIFATFKDSGNAVVAPSSMATITLTIKRLKDGAVVNSIEDTDIKDADRGTINGNTLEIRLGPNDTVLGGDRDELHVAIVKTTWNDGVATRSGIECGQYWVRSQVLP